MSFKLPEPYLKKDLNVCYREAGLKQKQIRLLRDCFQIAANLYGVISIKDAYKVLSSYFNDIVSKDAFFAFAEIAAHEGENYVIMGLKGLEGKKDTTVVAEKLLFHIDYLFRDGWTDFNDTLFGGKKHPFYTLSYEEFLKYKDTFYYEATMPAVNLNLFIGEHSTLDAEGIRDLVGALAWDFRIGNMNLQDVFTTLAEFDVDICDGEQEEFIRLIIDFHNNSRKHALRGYTPQERMNAETSRPLKISDLSFGPGIQKML